MADKENIEGNNYVASPYQNITLLYICIITGVALGCPNKHVWILGLSAEALKYTTLLKL